MEAARVPSALPLPPSPPLPTLPVPPSELAIALVLAAIGATLQGSVGLGLAVVAAPILLLLNPLWVPGPMLLAALVLVLLIAYRDRAHIIAPDVALATSGRVLGTIPAAYAMNLLPGEIYDLAFGAIVLLGVLLSVSGWHIARTPRNVVFSGIFSGIASTMSAVGGPPMALDLSARPRPERPRHDVGDLHSRHDHLDRRTVVGRSLQPDSNSSWACC